MDWLHLLVFYLCLSNIEGQAKITNQTEAQAALKDYNRRAEEVTFKAVEAAWEFNTDITDENSKNSVAQDLIAAAFSQEASANMSRFDTSGMSEPVKREIKKILNIGTAAQTDNAKLTRLKQVTSDMESIYSTAEVCLSKTECLSLEPGLTKLMANSRDYDRLLKAWVGWRDASGKKMKKLYSEFVTLSNEALKILGYPDTGDYWRSGYEMDNFEDEVKKLFEQLRPLYEQLHAYVRKKLKAKYGASKFPSTGHIPAHLLGNMWAQQWNSLVDDLMPFKDKPSMDVTAEMVKQGYDADKIFRTADDFFGSLGLIKMPQEFWNKSMLVKPADGRKVVCHASAWDFYNKKDFRIKQCTDITQEHFETAHHEMGHIEYFLQYKDLPVNFRGGANPGFHEAVGDVMSLSVQTPEHMQKIGLLKNIVHDEETDINFLMSMALQKIAFLPFGYLIDQWRWGVFRGDTLPDQYTAHWWDLRCKYQGISSPVKRTSSDFDPGAKYHIPANTPYIRYFVSFVIQFQFHKAACNASGHSGPLHRCDIYNSTAAGTALGNMLKLGSSKPWPEAMKQLTGQRDMSAQPLMDYFDPLLKFFKKENGDDHGWKDNCPKSSAESRVNIAPSVQIAAFLFILNNVSQILWRT